MVYTAIPPAPRRSALASYDYDPLDDLLYDWYCREHGYSPVVGYGREAASNSSAVSSDQWDHADDVINRRIEAYVMPLVSACIDDLCGDYRLAILTEQRNRLGPTVYRNPRAGDRQPEVYKEAKDAIAPRLRRRGVEW